MNFDEIKEIITSFLIKIYILCKNNKIVIVLIALIIGVILLNYFYSEERRINTKLNFLNNSLVYDVPRLQIDYCGTHSSIKNKFLCKIEKVSPSGLKFIEKDLWNYNLSSEFVVEIKGIENKIYNTGVNEQYKVKNISPDEPSIVYFTKDIVEHGLLESDEKNVMAEITFYNVNPNNTENPYKFKRLCEYYVSSSFNCFLIGNRLFDYCSLEMVKKVLYFGARYIEIPIFDKENKNDTIPIIYSGIRDYKLSINYLEVEKVIETIGKFAFNNRYLDNYNDPLFIYLDIKTSNIQTLDKVYDYILKYLKQYLLPVENKSSNSPTPYFVSGHTKLCDLTRKCVLFSNSGSQTSKLKNIINCWDKLKRITYNEAQLSTKDILEPKLKISSNKIRFVSNNKNQEERVFKDYIEIYDNNINLFNYGLVKGDEIFTSGSKKALNNSSGGSFRIHGFTQNKIYFDTNTTLQSEELGSYITLEIYDKNRSDITLEEYNKDNLTIVIPDARKSTSNQNFKNIMYKGCQFIPMNFQTVDKYMLDYFDYFKQKSFIFKPRVLIKALNIPKSVSINSMVPNFSKDIVLDIDYSFIDKLREARNATITPYNNKNLRLISSGFDDRNVKFSLNFNQTNSSIIVEPGLNKQSGYVSFKLDQRYLTYQECCCYLYFTKPPPTTIKDNMVKFNFNEKASFLSLTPISANKDYNSFGVVKNMNDKDVLYYLKIRSNFSSDKKLFVKNIQNYEVKFFLTSRDDDDEIDDGEVVVLKPKFNKNGKFFPTGDIVVKKSNLNKFNIDDGADSDAGADAGAGADADDDIIDKSILNYTRPSMDGDLYCTGNYDLFGDMCTEKCDYGSVRSPLGVCSKNGKDIVSSEPTKQAKYKCIDGYTKFSSNEPTESDNDRLCYKECEPGFEGNGTNCEIKNPDAKETNAVDESNYINPRQDFTTKLFSGAVDHPKDYELIWDNDDDNDVDNDLKTHWNGKQISIWKPVPKNGFMEMGCVFVEGYKKPSINDVVCISVDYINEVSISSKLNIDNEYDPYGVPIFCNKKKQLALWDIPNHNYVKAYPFVKYKTTTSIDDGILIPNSIEFKMYDFITEDKDYYDRLYLDTNVGSNKEKDSAIFNVKFDTIVPPAGNEVYDYLMELENMNGKLLSYTPSESGRKMCLALPQPYWSLQYDDVTSKYKRDENLNDTKKFPKVKFEGCKTRDYFGTNWNIYDDNTVRLEGNKEQCLTYNGNPESSISLDINDENNYLFLDKCNSEDNSKKQQFEFIDNNIKVVTNTDYEPNACLTHTPEDGLRLEECGDKKFTVISKWNNKIATVDKCNKIDADAEMKRIGSMEQCDDRSFYVVYLSDGIKHTHDEFCDYDEAKEHYDDVKKNYRRGIGIINKGNIVISKTNNTTAKNILKNYAIKLSNNIGGCVECKYPSKVVCVENSVIQSEHTKFQNDNEKREISDYCAKLKTDSAFKCSRGYRQKFINNINPSDFCLAAFKEVWVYIYSKDQYSEQNFGIDVSRKSSGSEFSVEDNRMAPVDNLLGETYDNENYHMFIKGLCTTSPDTNKFRIIFNNIQGKKNYLDLYKFSNDIILNYIPRYDDLIKGTKVLVSHGIKKDSDEHFFEDIGSNSITFAPDEVKWMGVVIKKLANNKVEIMLSINSYESNIRYRTHATNKKRPFSTSNITKIVHINDIVLLKKAPLCV